MPIIKAGPYEIYAAYIEARKHPKLVHYAGFEKPWDAPFSDYAYLFWHFAKDSEFYDRLLGMLELGKIEKKQGILVRMFPRGSKRRTWAKRIFYRATDN
jgi:lipopolysaccharide biosynthesis glycosyltransferase